VRLTDHTIGATLAWSAFTAFMACLCPIVASAFDETAAEALSNIRPEAIRADMLFLADDLLEGRGTGTRGHEIAARFIATEFESLGLEPAGESGTFFQRVPFRDFRPNEKRTSLTVSHNGKTTRFVLRRDFITYRQTTRSDTFVKAPVVYVGYGVTAPELGYDDYAGVDAKGKIVAFLYGAPPRFESTMRAHHSFRALKAENAAAHGAVGFLYRHSPAQEHLYSFQEQANDLIYPDLHWLNPRGIPGDDLSQLHGYAILSLEGVRKLLTGSGKTPDQVARAAEQSRPAIIFSSGHGIHSRG
jgi:hypothetical protein